MKRIILVCSLLVFPLFLLATSSSIYADGENQTTRYLAPNGIDSGDCSSRTSPCASVQYVLTKAAKADPVFMAGGEYRIAAEEVVHFTGDKVPLLPGYSRRDLYNTKSLQLNQVTLVGVPHFFRTELEAKGFRVLADTKSLNKDERDSVNKFTQAFIESSRKNKPATACVGGQAGNFECNNIDLQSQLTLNNMSSTPNSGNDIWGHVDLNNNREYAIMGLQNGTIIVDVTDPENPSEVGTISGVSSTWRDMKVYQYLDGSEYTAYAYVTNETGQGLQIIDLNDLPNSVSLAASITDFTTAHNIYISNVDYSTNTALVGMDPYIYIAGSNRSGGAYRVYDLTDPLAPQIITTPPAGTGYVHDATSVVIDDNRTSQCAAGHDPCEVFIDYNEFSVDLWDMTDKDAPVLLSQTGYSNTGYTHSGWFSEDKNYVYIQDELDEQSRGINTRVIVMNISDLTSPSIVGAYSGPTRAIDHNGFTKGDKYYMSNYRRGLTVLDLSNPALPVESGFFDTFPSPSSNSANFYCAWGTYPYLPSGNILVSDINNGLFVLSMGSSAGTLQPQIPSAFSEDVGTVTINVNRQSGSFGAVSVDYATADNTASAGTDYTASSGTLNWADGDSSTKSITIEILPDDVAENNETFALNFSNVQGNAGLANANVNLTIQANDRPGSVGFSTNSTTTDEEAGTVNLSVSRTGGSVGAVSVGYQTVDGTATSGSDYTSTTGTLSWADGELGSKSFTVDLVDDNDMEDAEAFTINLTDPQNGVTLETSLITVNINASDARGELGFTSSSQSVAENVQSISLSVARVGGQSGEVSLDFTTVDGSATAGSDYGEISGTLTWADGDSAAKTITVEITDDSAEESSEAFSVELSNATNQASLGNDKFDITIQASDTSAIGPPETTPPPVTSSGGGSFGWSLLVLLFGFRLKRKAS